MDYRRVEGLFLTERDPKSRKATPSLRLTSPATKQKTGPTLQLNWPSPQSTRVPTLPWATFRSFEKITALVKWLWRTVSWPLTVLAENQTFKMFSDSAKIQQVRSRSKLRAFKANLANFGQITTRSTFKFHNKETQHTIIYSTMYASGRCDKSGRKHPTYKPSF